MEALSFSYNWNNKLHCNYFTTLRLYNEKKYFVGNKLAVDLNMEQLKVAEVVGHKKILITDINDFIAGLDTGYTVTETVNILKRMYPKANWQTQYLSFVLLKTVK